MRYLKQIAGVWVFCLIGVFGRAQDFHLSMYDAAPIFLNPAMTGVFEGDWRLHAHYRTQWKAVNFKPYTTGLISFDMPKNKWGFGGQIANYRAGIGNYNVLQGLVSTAYTTPLDAKKQHNLSFGIQAGLTQKSVEYQLHTYNNQYVTRDGGGFDQSLSSGESFAGQRDYLPDVNAGLLYFFAKQQSKVNPFAGLSVFNLLQPTETFLGNKNKLPLRYYTHIGARINLTEQLYLIPKVLWMQQLKFNEQTYALDAGYYLKDPELYLLAGGVFRKGDAAIAYLGLKKFKFIFKVGYDINLSTLTVASGGRGGFEVSFTYLSRKEDPKTKKICPRL